jgi:acyl phosphate:glycerol-3-phosphate acyltransferase
VTQFFLSAAASYLLGSIPFGYILVRTFRGQDVRQTGSGNIGATNVARSSMLLGIVTLFLDALKGTSAVGIARTLNLGSGYRPVQAMVAKQDLGLGQAQSPLQQAFLIASVAALFVMVGHVFPVWLRFRGGKGVATGLGAFLLVAPKTMVVVVAIFVLVLAAFRRVSLASIVAVAAFPVLAWMLKDYHDSPLALACMLAASALIIAKHRANINRLISGTEPRFQLGRT